MTLERDRKKANLPVRPFLYTLDQLASILAMSEEDVARKCIYFQGRSTGVRSSRLMIAHNIASAKEEPAWRVSERELIRWMKLKGFVYYEKAGFRG